MYGRVVACVKHVHFRAKLISVFRPCNHWLKYKGLKTLVPVLFPNVEELSDTDKQTKLTIPPAFIKTGNTFLYVLCISSVLFMEPIIWQHLDKNVITHFDLSLISEIWFLFLRPGYLFLSRWQIKGSVKLNLCWKYAEGIENIGLRSV